MFKKKFQQVDLFGSYVEITSGLEEGEKIIDNLNEKIKDGIQVKVL